MNSSGPIITMAMAKKEGWATKSGQQVADHARADDPLSRCGLLGPSLYASDMLLGIQTQEEVVDIEPVTVKPELPKTSLEELNATIAQPEEVIADELF
jgi:hypothetical protein